MIRVLLIDVGETVVQRISDKDVPLRSQSMRPFPDSAAALGEIRSLGYRIAAVSNTEQSDDAQLRDALGRAGLGALFDAFVTSISIGERKPKPGMYLAALDRVGCTPSEAVMAGDDARVDLAGATALGIATVLVNRPGSKGPADDAPATYVVTSLAELPAILERLNDGVDATEA